MGEQLPMIERVLALLPLDGRPIAYGRMRELIISVKGTEAALAELCTAQRAAVETHGGYTFARRLPVLIAFPLRARPARPPPPLRRRPQPPAPAMKRGRAAR